MGADTLIGNDVCNRQDEHLGDIKEIMPDVPWAALTLDTASKRFVIDVTRERLESAPGFDQQQWPDMADATCDKGVVDIAQLRADRREAPPPDRVAVYRCHCMSAAAARARHARRLPMPYDAVVSFVIAPNAALFGFGGIVAGAIKIARWLFIVFAVLVVASLLAGLLRGAG